MRKLRSKWADDDTVKEEAVRVDDEVRAKVVTSVKGKALKSKWAQDREDDILKTTRIETVKNYVPKKTMSSKEIKKLNQEADELKPTHKLSEAAKLFAERLDDKSNKDSKVIVKPAPSKYPKSFALKLGSQSENSKSSRKEFRVRPTPKTGNEIAENILDNDETELSTEEKIRLDKLVQDLKNPNLNWADIDGDDDVFA